MLAFVIAHFQPRLNKVIIIIICSLWCLIWFHFQVVWFQGTLIEGSFRLLVSRSAFRFKLVYLFHTVLFFVFQRF